MKRTIALTAAVCLLAVCSAKKDPSAGAGTLSLVANGEDFVRQGFTSKDGWAIAFDNLYVTIDAPRAFQLAASGDKGHTSIPVDAYGVGLEGVHTVDLAAGGPDAASITVGTVKGARAGNYNALRFGLVPAASGPAAGMSILLAGKAEKDGKKVAFNLGIPSRLSFTCGGYVGDELKGILAAGGAAESEMTFHFDHLFGDAEQPMDDHINKLALGFGFLAERAKDGAVALTAAEGALPGDVQKQLDGILVTLGHTGEGHCDCSR